LVVTVPSHRKKKERRSLAFGVSPSGLGKEGGKVKFRVRGARSVLTPRYTTDPVDLRRGMLVGEKGKAWTGGLEKDRGQSKRWRKTEKGI